MTPREKFKQLVADVAVANVSESTPENMKKYEQAAYALAMFCIQHEDYIEFRATPREEK